MRAIKLMTAGTAVAALLLGTSTVAVGQETVGDDGLRYISGEAEGYFHHDGDNPLGCEIGFTSDSHLFGESTLLGATSVRQLNCYVPADTLENVQRIRITFTGEDGDTLAGSGNGDCIPDEVLEAGDFWSCWGPIVIDGGTGVFEGARGEIHVLAYIVNAQSDHPDAAPGDLPMSMLFEGLVEH